ncbi:GspH/FimT family pseudopilin [Pelomonas sp. SE-A7]|uniref:GspH/FimT family pseudopilin n=1 Tax=Pelomonas sp. SE-A7 TaxID=3054953 RepID=UPI00259CC5BE|nr:GspH/FimT family pseudopilin [Pelomonas sp. SE-A7]MDM4767715.1 GspH/FimT family pseudopilin [Pelomonas sp. SE-A7]
MLSRQAVRGFTLVETAVVLVILGVMLAVALPQAADWLRGLRVRNAAEGVKNGLELARMEALRRNSTVGLWLVSDSSKVPTDNCVLSSTSPAWVVSVADPAGKCGQEASLTAAPQLVQRSAAQENASNLSVSALDSAGAAADRVMFNGLGQVQPVTGNKSIQTVDVEASAGGGRRLRVVVESGGAIRMCDRGAASDDPRACPAL